jgi:membrane-bound lytic murein transglycosylase B
MILSTPKTFGYFLSLSLGLVLMGCAGTPVDSVNVATAQTQPTPGSQTSQSDVIEVFSGYMSRNDVQAYLIQLSAERNIPVNEIASLLAQAKRLPIAVRLMTPPDPDSPRPQKDWARYRQNFVEPIRIEAGKAFMEQNQNVLRRAEQRYGVPANIIAAIIGVETLYGRHMGNYRVLDAVTTLSFDYPDPSRQDRIIMFQGQLADLIELHTQGKLDASTQLGSYAGAMGIPQFMPSSLKVYAVAADPEASAIDLENSIDDAVMSVANFLVQHGWITGLPVFAPVELPSKAADLVDGGLSPTLSWAELRAHGARLDRGATEGAWSQYPLGVINLPLPTRDTVEYRTATPNFFALTQYNRSYFYATAVSDLAQALGQEKSSQ